MSRRGEAADLLLGVAVVSMRVGGASARVAMAPVALAARTPVVERWYAAPPRRRPAEAATLAARPCVASIASSTRC